MTQMKRITVSLTGEIHQAVEALGRTPAFAGASYAEIVRTLLLLGLRKEAEQRGGGVPWDPSE